MKLSEVLSVEVDGVGFTYRGLTYGLGTYFGQQSTRKLLSGPRTVGLWAEYILWTTIDSNCCPVPVPWAYLWAVVHTPTYFGVWIK